jgi:hypothetical protein
MNKVVTASLAVLAVAASCTVVRAGWFGHKGSCEAPCAAEKPVLSVSVTEQRSTVEVPVHGYATEARVTEKTVPVCRTVPVCVTDPCTGCTHMECKTETVQQRVRTTTIDLVPPKECVKKEERSTNCITVYIAHVPVCAPAPCGH